MNTISKFLVIFVMIGNLLSFVSCNNNDRTRLQRFNDLSYSYHYRSLDSVCLYADSVLSYKHLDEDIEAEAMNNLAFYYIGKMKYAKADSLLSVIYSSTDNHIELLIASVQKMRICQRTANNKEYYEFRQHALNHLKRVQEETELSEHEKHRMVYAESELLLVSSIYDFYLGKTNNAIDRLLMIDDISGIRNDTAQYIAYLYNIGAGGILTEGTPESIIHEEMDYLLRAYMLSIDGGYRYWEANTLQSFGEHLNDGVNIYANDSTVMHLLNPENVSDTILAGNMSERALRIFTDYGDIYQEAASWRTLATCYWQLNDYEGAIYSLNNAVKDSLVQQSPALMSSIHEKYSLAYSALGMKKESDYHRNVYLDQYERSRQDKEYEARAEQLDNSMMVLNVLVIAIITVIVVLIVVLCILLHRKRVSMKNGGLSSRSNVMKKWELEHVEKLANYNEQKEEREEQLAMLELQLSRQQDEYVEHRAKMHLMNGITPLIDRMMHELKCLAENNESEDIRQSRMDYVEELINHINSSNDFLTDWIKLKQGELSLKIESFSLQELFDILVKNTATFHRQKITLLVEQTPLFVKADKSLTMFMINTLCDNARKYTSEGGVVRVSAIEHDDMVEIAVKDSGCGMTAEQVEHLFEHKVIVDEKSSSITKSVQQSHGFGLMNCKGIIEKYKKTNSLFKNCHIGVESEVGEGTRFFFRLPKGIAKILIVACMMLSNVLNAYGDNNKWTDVIQLSDSVYECNVQGRYEDAIKYATDCINSINATHLHSYPGSTDSLSLYSDKHPVPVEIVWYREGLEFPYSVVLSLRNEIAVAALAVNDWQLYSYNNKVYSLLFKEFSLDDSLAGYCEQMETSEANMNVAILLLIILLLAFIPVYYLLYYRHVIMDTRVAVKKMDDEVVVHEEELRNINERIAAMRFECDKLHVTNNVLINSFSTIKHETMYYPSRIRQMLGNEEVIEVAQFYRALYEVLFAQIQYNCQQMLMPSRLFDMLKTKMARIAAIRKSEIPQPDIDDRYAVYTLLIVKNDEIVMRICTQITRDLGETYGKRRCGVQVVDDKMIVTIPVEVVK